jgi:NAD(P)-dependent dehydrogenase (short-subunit alcohol dehydrogenase family)
MKRFSSTTVVITGGNSGIGRTAALRFAAEGANVAIIARTADTGNAVVQEIAEGGGEACFFQADVADAVQVDRAYDAILARFGSFHAAFNCSGVTGQGKLFHEVTAEEFDRVVQTNLYGVFHCMKREIAHFVAKKGGVIVNCASTSGLVGFPYLSAYNASKHAVLGLTKSVALDYAKLGIRVNAVCPGGVMTSMLAGYLEENPDLLSKINSSHPMGRMATTDEVAGLVLWLCSDEAANVIGQSYAIDGGYTVQ